MAVSPKKLLHADGASAVSPKKLPHARLHEVVDVRILCPAMVLCVWEDVSLWKKIAQLII